MIYLLLPDNTGWQGKSFVQPPDIGKEYFSLTAFLNMDDVCRGKAVESGTGREN